MSVNGLHHVTAIAGDAQGNVDFYAGVLGLRLVKRTVNFDDPLTYHLYYGTELGAPGTILTFFAWPNAYRGRVGSGQVNATGLSVPKGSLGWWQERFKSRRVRYDLPVERYGDEVLPFQDGDGMPLELVAVEDVRPAWRGGGVPEEYAIRGVHGITAHEEGHESTAKLLTETLLFTEVGQEGNRFRYRAGEGAPGSLIDVLCTPDGQRSRGGVGMVHHIAWRVPDDPDQLAWRKTLVGAGMNVSPVLDRQYFHSIYFREPGGVLFEIATDKPGFATDEPKESLGGSLRLPPWLEGAREQIAAGLTPITLPGMSKFTYRYVPGERAETLLLLHGTGGNEEDLLEIGAVVLPGAGLLSPRGQVLENGMPRFFRRLAEGVFDLEDVKARAAELGDFVREQARERRFDPARVWALGYSNGANIAAAMLLTGAARFPRAVLLRAMVPLEPTKPPDLAGDEVLLATGTYDPMATAAQTSRLRELLSGAGATVTEHVSRTGHQLMQEDIEAAARWLARG